uniref:Uncharacterized protein n=1 Tax=Chlorobium chlorochromatii (strain CaD3) TaxID=340177 RepID=Q3AU95_CHLCH
MKQEQQHFLQEKLRECDRHVEKITIAQEHMRSVLPLTPQVYAQLDDVALSFLDQIVFRYSKLQDTLGDKVFPLLLLATGEEVKRKTFLDILNRLEELELVDRMTWLQLREARNEVTHDYSSEVGETVDAINAIIVASDTLQKLYSTIRHFCNHRLQVL